MKLFLLLVLVALLGSCIKEIDKVPAFEGPKLVVNSLINPDSMVRVNVSLSGSNAQGAQFLNDVNVQLFEDGQLIVVLSYDTLGWYQSNFYPVIGKLYKLVVNSSAYGSVTAQTRIPLLPLELTGIYYKASALPIQINGPVAFYDTETEVQFKDAADEANYYEVGENRFLYEQTQEKDPSILMDGDLSYNPLTYYFSDFLFDGANKHLVLRKGGEVSLMQGVEVPIEQYPLRFRSCSSAYYQFRKSWTKHLYNQTLGQNLDDPIQLLFFGDPVVMFSNVQGGYGVFAGYNETIISVQYVP